MTDQALVRQTEQFADEVASLLQSTVCPDARIIAEVVENRVRVSSPLGGDKPEPLRLAIDGRQLLNLEVRWRCTWDHAGRYLSVTDSKFALTLPHLREPLVRVEYQKDRSYFPAHVQVHAESGAFGYLRAFHPDDKPPKLQRLHLPVGDRRFRPCLEDVVEMAVRDLNVDVVDEAWLQRVNEGRDRWRVLQTKAAIRDVVKRYPDLRSELREVIEADVL